ncbi:MAG: TraG/TraD/VirD4 family protein, partial [Syntrophorhabdaceae bacterium]|nr:TraG/TraD/VirD4 family protein [Syntrophorhabdaceae bacterium]
LRAIYKDNAETIIGNCDSMIFLGGREKSTLEEVSKTLGKETIHTYNHSENRGNSPSFGKSYQKLGKDLMSIDELAVLDNSKCILQLRGVRPFLSNKYDITRHKNYKYLSDYDKKYTFNTTKFLNTKLVVKTDDVFDVYETGVTDDEADEITKTARSPPQVTFYINYYK